MEIPAKDLVPGDVVCLEAGRQVPADVRLSRTMSLKSEESALTGESVPVEKDAGYLARGKADIVDCRNMAYMTTNVTYGRIRERGSHEELMRQDGAYAALYKIQAKNYRT